MSGPGPAASQAPPFLLPGEHFTAAVVFLVLGAFGVIVVARAAGLTSVVPLMPHDVIRSVNHRRVGTLQDLRAAMGEVERGTAVTLQIQREARLMFVTFTRD